MDANVWKTTPSAVNWFALGPENSATSAISFPVIRMCDMTEKQPHKFSNKK